MEPLRRISLAEYLALDAGTDIRYEYRSGYAIALATPSRNHGRIAGNLSVAVGSLARASGCDFFAGDAKVVTAAGDRLIPDFTITCDDRDRRPSDDRGENLLRHPWFVVEILSPATAEDDATTKFDSYQTIDALTHYVTIDSRRRAMRIFSRDDAGVFRAAKAVRTISLPRIGATLDLEAVYAETTVPSIDVGFATPRDDAVSANPVVP